MAKNKKLLFSSLTFALLLTLVGGFALTSYAAAPSSNTTGATLMSRLKNHRVLTSDKLATMKKNQAAVKAALEANDYNAWVTAVGASSAIAQKINASNFPQLVQIYQLEKQISTLKTGLGISKGNGWGMGMTSLY